MIDIHCHILPGLDDGAEDIEEALIMARLAEADGIEVIFATPHINHGFNLSKEEIAEALELFRRRVKTEGIRLQIIPGADIDVGQPDLERRIVQRQVMTLNDAGKYVLLELPYQNVPPIHTLVDGLLEQGVIPIISHPERNLEIQRHPQKLVELAHKGALAQITAFSLTGEFGQAAQKSATRLLKEGRVHFIATDAHNAIMRPPMLSIAHRLASKILGADHARRLVLDNPQAILDTSPLPTT